MARIEFEPTVDYFIGVDRGMIYPKDSVGIAWHGLIDVEEKPKRTGMRVRYVDGQKIYQKAPPGEFSGSVQAFTYPEEIFSGEVGFSYTNWRAENLQIHLVYNARFSPGGISYRSFESEPFTLSFETRNINIPRMEFSSHLIVETSDAYSWVVEKLQDIIYGSNETQPRLPDPQELWDLFEENSIVRVIDHGDGSFTVMGPDKAVKFLEPTVFEINWPSVVYLNADTYEVSSL